MRHRAANALFCWKLTPNGSAINVISMILMLWWLHMPLLLGGIFGHLKIHFCCTLKFLDCLHKWCLMWFLWLLYEVSQLGLSIYNFICVYTSTCLCICLLDHAQISQPVKEGPGASDPEVFLSMRDQNMAPALLDEIDSRHEMLVVFSFLTVERWVSGRMTERYPKCNSSWYFPIINGRPRATPRPKRKKKKQKTFSYGEGKTSGSGLLPIRSLAWQGDGRQWDVFTHESYHMLKAEGPHREQPSRLPGE